MLYKCDFCNFSSSNRTNYNKHITTQKHINACKILLDIKSIDLPEKTEIEPEIEKFICSNCSREYKDRTGLWKHNKRCCSKKIKKVKTQSDNIKHESISENKILLTENEKSDMIIALIKQNQELQQQIIDITKLGVNITNNVTNNNVTNNNQFNLNIFLNETCKDAVNLLDFVNSLKIQLTDLENTAKLGYVGGITKIILDGMKELDINKRPIHCTDIKRETIYVKDKGAWEREDDERTHLKYAINVVAHKNIQQIPLWHDENPECMDVTNKKSNEYLNIMIKANGGNREEVEKYTEKIIKNLVKEVAIEK